MNASKTSDNENEVDIAVNPANPLQVFAVANSSGSFLRMSVSTDGGATFTNRLGATGSDGITAACCDARVVFDGFGNLWMVYLNTSASQLVIVRSTNGGQSFSPYASFSGGWDNPSIVAGYNNTIHVLATGPSGQAVTGTTVSGFGTAGTFPSPTTIAGTGNAGFGDITVGLDGSIVATFHNNTGSTTADTLPIYRDADGLGAGGFTAVTSISTNVGGFEPIPAQASRTIDAEPNFAVVPAGAPHAGRIFLTYTDETVNGSDNTDIMLRWSDNNGLNWSSPIKLNDDSTTRSQFLQSIAIDKSTGTIGVFWYDARNDVGTATGGFTDTTANNEAQIYAVFSIDGGDSWQPNVVLQSSPSKSSTAGSPTDFGDWTGADFYAGNFYAAWTDNSLGLSPANTSRPKLDIAVGQVSVNTTPITGVTGTVWDDADADGVFDPNESGVAGATVFIDADNDGILDAGETSITTSASGIYSFTGLTAGTYTLKVITPGRRITAPAGGVITVTLAANQFLLGQNFGATATVSLSGVAFDDLNGNGVRDAGEPGISGARVYLDANNNGTYDAGAQSVVSSDVPRTISASGTPTVLSTLTAPATLGQVAKVTVQLNITHTWVSDLVLTLIAPDGTRVLLSSGVGGSADNYTNTIFDDAAATSINSGTAPFTGTFRPAEALSALLGKQAAGTWTLEVKDVANTDGGTLNSWSLNIQFAETNTITDANGNYAFPTLAAGNYNLRQVLSPGYGFTDPASGVYNVPAAGGSVLTRDFASRDLDRPLISSKQFLVDAPTQRVTVTFSEDVIITQANLVLTDLTHSTIVPGSSIDVSFDSATDTATITFPGFANGILPDADYRLAINGTVTDLGGKALANPGVVDFYTLAGDANRDRHVNFDDLVILAQNYGQGGKTFTQGNFDYSADGVVGFSDLVLLAQKYNASLGAFATLLTAPASPTTKRRVGPGQDVLG